VRISLPRSAASDALVAALTGFVAETPAAIPASAEVQAEADRKEMTERVHRALFSAVREANARGEILDVMTWEREVVLTEEL